jgi:hypothetical protein
MNSAIAAFVLFIAAANVAAAQDLAIVDRDELIRGDAPRAHLQKCLSRNMRTACLSTLVYWGHD